MLRFPVYFRKEVYNLLGAVGPPICTENCTTLLEVLITALIS
jgi:hypothetical protein